MFSSRVYEVSWLVCSNVQVDKSFHYRLMIIAQGV